MTTRPSRAFRPLPTPVNLPALEHDIISRWRENRVFERSVEQTADGPLWVFYEGPPTGNGRPGVHHVEARAFKDLFPRYKTMKGFHVPRRGGWDCHGLPVEITVEGELGFKTKRQIEEFGIAEFNERCRESVRRYVDEWERMSQRMGFWVDMSKAYWTMTPDYVESVWWSLKQVFDKGLLVQDYRVSPYCPRCETGLSDHELGQPDVYQLVADPSVYVRFPVTGGSLADTGASLLVWTTTPWTLISNTAVAVHPDVTYVAARHDGEVLVVAEPLLTTVLGESAEVLQRLTGRELEHTTYQRPFEIVELPEMESTYVVLADYVTIEDGTGLVHQAPAFGAEDLEVSRRYGLPVVNPIDTTGHFDPTLPLVGGQFFKAADPDIVEDLRARGLLFRAERYEHSYPHCWRCDTSLIYYALPSWFIRTTEIKQRLLEENARTDWHPTHIRDGRYGDWLHNNVDWALSRDRYWGTPLPIWRCANGHLTCVGSLAELGERAGRDLSGLDPHRPYVDEVVFACPQCEKEAKRVPPVIDAWYDSGSMPFAQWGAPHRNNHEFTEQYPADFIAEAIDQTRGWFYTLMAVGTLVFDRSSYQTVLCLGHIQDEQGRKMSKHLGNVLDPFELFDRHGADAVRWLMLCTGNPWTARRVGHHTLDEVVRKVLLTYWNTASFLVLYAQANDWLPDDAAPPPAERALLDRWALSELHRTVREVDEALDVFDTVRAGRRLSEFIDDLSNWYVRRSRRRFWDGDPAALATLHTCIDLLSRLLAPFLPFIADEVHQRVVVEVCENVPDSVHLCEWPTADETLIDSALSDQIAFVRRHVELGRAARADAAVRTRQPLRRALVGANEWAALPEQLKRELADELNVLQVDALSSEADLVEYSVKPNFRSLGRKFGNRTPQVAAELTAADPAGVATSVRGGGVTLTVEGDSVELEPDDVMVTEVPRAGWAVGTSTGETVALDLELTDELRRAGTAREVVRLIQEARKATDLDVSDRIDLWWQSADEATATAVREHMQTIAGEVLAIRVEESPPTVDVTPHGDDELKLTFWLRRSGE